MTVWNKLSLQDVIAELNFSGFCIIEKNFDYKNMYEKIDLIDNGGYKYRTSLGVVRNQNKRNGDIEKFGKQNPFTLENISLWLRKNKTSLILIGGEYSNSKQTLLIKCERCGMDYYSSWNSLQNPNAQCHYCSGRRISDMNRLSILFPDLCEEWDWSKNDKGPEEYSFGSNTKVFWRCKVCDYSWKTDICLRTGLKRGCPNCAKSKSLFQIGIPSMRRKSKDTFLQELYYLYGDEYSVIGDYIDAGKKVLIRHNSCGFEWMIIPQSLLNKRTCPFCNSSNGEFSVQKFLKSNCVQFFREKSFLNCRNKNPLPFDFYLPDYNCCIEYQGEQHYEPRDFAGRGKEWAQEQFIIIKNNDEIKENFCEENNIPLLRIPYWDFNNIEVILSKELFS